MRTLTRTKSGSDLTGSERSTVQRGSSLRWPLWPENPTRNESSFAASIGSISWFLGVECLGVLTLLFYSEWAL